MIRNIYVNHTNKDKRNPNHKLHKFNPILYDYDHHHYKTIWSSSYTIISYIYIVNDPIEESEDSSNFAINSMKSYRERKRNHKSDLHPTTLKQKQITKHTTIPKKR